MGARQKTVASRRGPPDRRRSRAPPKGPGVDARRRHKRALPQSEGRALLFSRIDTCESRRTFEHCAHRCKRTLARWPVRRSRNSLNLGLRSSRARGAQLALRSDFFPSSLNDPYRLGENHAVPHENWRQIDGAIVVRRPTLSARAGNDSNGAPFPPFPRRTNGDRSRVPVAEPSHATSLADVNEPPDSSPSESTASRVSPRRREPPAPCSVAHRRLQRRARRR